MVRKRYGQIQTSEGIDGGTNEQMDKCTNRERVVRKMNRQTDAVMVGGADVRMDR
jgi:hypothetical protein